MLRATCIWGLEFTHAVHADFINLNGMARVENSCTFNFFFLCVCVSTVKGGCVHPLGSQSFLFYSIIVAGSQ